MRMVRDDRIIKNVFIKFDLSFFKITVEIQGFKEFIQIIDLGHEHTVSIP
jgi:hypothetical protein